MRCLCLTPNLCVYSTEFLIVSLPLMSGYTICKCQTTSILNRSVSRVNYVDDVLKGWHQCRMSRSTWAQFDVSASISCVHIIDTHLLKRERGNRGFSATAFIRRSCCLYRGKAFVPEPHASAPHSQTHTRLKKLNRKSYFTNTTTSLHQLDKNNMK